ncbi:MAG: type II toxin-antitoxin system RelE/ParE family toxin [Phycisphaerales bacterium]|nr:type II toxin-antitoxin system RelE/ParE family toxin [Phycisphaerales bacterium]
MAGRERPFARRILDKIDALQTNPFPQDVKRLQGNRLLRVRVGGARVLYEVDHATRRLGVIKIDTRARVYE